MKKVILFLFVPLALAAGESRPQLAQTGFTSASVCGQCHQAIYQGWKGSMHANAVNDPVFYPIFLETSRETDGKSDALCLSCHAPTTRVTNDWKLQNPLTREGVTCDFCHSVKSVKPGARDPFEVVSGKTKWGPLKNLTSPAHQAVYSDLFDKAALCGACHNYNSPHGVPVLETYSEWMKSPQAQEGKLCQTCHMPPIKGLVVPSKIKPTNEIYINSHEAAGGHFIEQIKKAISVKLDGVRRDGDKVHALVRLENVGSGHKVPTGLPTRKLVLHFQVSSSGVPIYSEERVFQKVVLDEQGEPITKDSALFLHAAKIKADNRLEPRVPRVEDFTFLAPEGKVIDIEVQVYYLYQPRLIEETEMKVELGTESQKIPAR